MFYVFKTVYKVILELQSKKLGRVPFETCVIPSPTSYVGSAVSYLAIIYSVALFSITQGHPYTVLHSYLLAAFNFIIFKAIFKKPIATHCEWGDQLLVVLLHPLILGVEGSI